VLSAAGLKTRAKFLVADTYVETGDPGRMYHRVRQEIEMQRNRHGQSGSWTIIRTTSRLCRSQSRAVGRYGYRRITKMLRTSGWLVNKKRVERLWRREGLSRGGHGCFEEGAVREAFDHARRRRVALIPDQGTLQGLDIIPDLERRHLHRAQAAAGATTYCASYRPRNPCSG